MEIDVTKVDTITLVKAAYALSKPRGLGFLHFRLGDELTDDEAQSLIEKDGGVQRDYVRGRGCKFSVRVKNGKKIIYSPWYDHTDMDLQELLRMCGVSAPVTTENHGVACACLECEAGRRGITN